MPWHLLCGPCYCHLAGASNKHCGVKSTCCTLRCYSQHPPSMEAHGTAHTCTLILNHVKLTALITVSTTQSYAMFCVMLPSMSTSNPYCPGLQLIHFNSTGVFCANNTSYPGRQETSGNFTFQSFEHVPDYPVQVMLLEQKQTRARLLCNHVNPSCHCVPVQCSVYFLFFATLTAQVICWPVRWSSGHGPCLGISPIKHPTNSTPPRASSIPSVRTQTKW